MNGQENGSTVTLSLGHTALASLAVIVAAIGGMLMTWLCLDWSIGYTDRSLYFTLGTLAGTTTGGGAMALVLRRRDPLSYLGLTTTQPRMLVLGALAGLGLAALFGLARWLVSGNPAAEDWTATYLATAHSPVLLVLAAFVAIPLLEECLFRGLLHRGLAATRLGANGTICVTALLFMIIQSPDDLIGAFQSLALGVLLGVLRVRAGTIGPGLIVRVIDGVFAVSAAAAFAAT